MMVNHKHGIVVRSNLLHSSLSKLCKNARPKSTCFHFSSTSFNMQGHMPSMDGVPLRASPMAALKSLVWQILVEAHFFRSMKLNLNLYTCIGYRWPSNGQQKKKDFFWLAHMVVFKILSFLYCSIFHVWKKS